ncbi:HSP70-domain-containing protein, partial [Pluteus cervinus]
GAQLFLCRVSFTDDERLTHTTPTPKRQCSTLSVLLAASRRQGRKTRHEALAVQGQGEKNGKPAIVVQHKGQDREFTAEEISAMILVKTKEVAEAYLGEKVTHAVVTVIAYFNNAQRQATKDAGTIAGLQVLRIINKPTAIAYGLNKKGGESQIIVYHLGGGTFDVLPLSTEDGVFEAYKKKTGTDVSKYLLALGKLKHEVEKAKRTLSSQQSTRLEIESFKDGNDFSETLTRAKFEELNMDLFRKTMKPVEWRISTSHAGRPCWRFDAYSSGSTIVEDYFRKEPLKGINPDEAIAYGTAVQGGILSRAEGTGDVVLVGVNPLTLGIETTVDPLQHGLSDKDKKTIIDAVKETTDWIEENGSSASVEDLEDKLTEVQGVVNPITTKMSQAAGGAQNDDDEVTRNHDEL